jgi:hypothetical protein
MLIMNGGRRAGQVVDLVHFQEYRVNDVMPDELEAGTGEEVPDIFLGSSEKVVEAKDLVALLN